MKKIIINGTVRTIKETIEMYTFTEENEKYFDMDTIAYFMSDKKAFNMIMSEMIEHAITMEDFLRIYLENAETDLIIID